MTLIFIALNTFIKVQNSDFKKVISKAKEPTFVASFKTG